MADASDALYGSALTAAHCALRKQPKLLQICRLTRGGILAHEWTHDPAVSDYLGTVKPHRQAEAALRLLGRARQHMEGELARLRARYARITATGKFRSLPEVAQRCFHVLHARALDPADGGPDVMASVRVLAAAIAEVYGREYSPRAISYGVRCLEEAGLLTITHGVAYNGRDKAVASIYHLLSGEPDAAYFTSPEPGCGDRACEAEASPQFLARVQMAFSRAIELVRRFKRLLIEAQYNASRELWTVLLAGHRRAYHGLEGNS
jgi:hypothetical protein